MAEYIDRETLLSGIEELRRSPWANNPDVAVASLIDEALDIVEQLVIKNAPQVNVEADVVRCKDCQNRGFDNGDGLYWCDVNDILISDTFYCSNGENGAEK